MNQHKANTKEEYRTIQKKENLKPFKKNYFYKRKETKKMKKVLAIIFMMTMVISLFAACGNDAPANNIVDPDLNDNADVDADAITNNNNTDTTASVQNNNESHDGFSSSEEFIERIGEIVDLSLYEVDDEDADYVEIDLNSENEKPFNFNYRIDIGNDSIKLPVSFSDIKNSVFTTDINEDFSVSNKVQRGAEYKTTNGKEFTLWTTNLDAFFDDADVECDIKDCTFYGFSVEVYDDAYDDNDVPVYEKNDNVPDFNIHGITPDSTVEDVISAMENPTYITYYVDDNSIDITYSEKIGDSNTSADYSSLIIRFFADQNCIEKIEYEYAPAAVK